MGFWSSKPLAVATAVPQCSFCGKTLHDVRKLIAGPRVHICDECVSLCNDIIVEEETRGAARARGGRAGRMPSGRARPRTRSTKPSLTTRSATRRHATAARNKALELAPTTWQLAEKLRTRSLGPFR